MSEERMDIDDTTNKASSYQDEDQSGDDFEGHSDTSALMELAELACQSSTADASTNFQQALPTLSSVTIDSTENSCDSTVQKFNYSMVDLQLHMSPSPIQTARQKDDRLISLSTSYSNEENKTTNQFVTFNENKDGDLDEKAIAKEQLLKQILNQSKTPEVTCMNVEKSFDLPISDSDVSNISLKTYLPKISHRRKSVSIFDNSDSCDSDESSIEDSLIPTQKDIDTKNNSNVIKFSSNDAEKIYLQNDEKIITSDGFKNDCKGTAKNKVNSTKANDFCNEDLRTIGVSDARISISDQFEESKKLPEPDTDKISTPNDQEINLPTISKNVMVINKNLSNDTPSCKFEKCDPPYVTVKPDYKKGRFIDFNKKDFDKCKDIATEYDSNQAIEYGEEIIHDKTNDRNKTINELDLSKKENLLSDQQENDDKNIKSLDFCKDKLLDCTTKGKENIPSVFGVDKNLAKFVTNISKLSAEDQCNILESGDVDSDINSESRTILLDTKDNYSSVSLVQDSTLDLNMKRLSKSDVREDDHETTNNNGLAKNLFQDLEHNIKNDSAESIIKNADECNYEKNIENNGENSTKYSIVNDAENDIEGSRHIVNDVESNAENDIESNIVNDIKSNAENGTVNCIVNDVECNAKNDAEDNIVKDVERNAENDIESNIVNEAESNADNGTESIIVNDVDSNVKNDIENDIVNDVKSNAENDVKRSVVNFAESNAENGSESSIVNDIKSNAENGTGSSIVNDVESNAENNITGNIVNDAECNIKKDSESYIAKDIESKTKNDSENLPLFSSSSVDAKDMLNRSNSNLESVNVILKNSTVPEYSELKDNEAKEERNAPIGGIDDDMLKQSSGSINQGVLNFKIGINLDGNSTEESVNKVALPLKADITVDSSLKGISAPSEKNSFVDMAIEVHSESTEVEIEKGNGLDSESNFEQIKGKVHLDLYNNESYRTKDCLNTFANTIQDYHNNSVASDFASHSTLDNVKDTIATENDKYAKKIELTATSVTLNTKEEEAAISINNLSGNSKDTPESINNNLHTCVNISGASAEVQDTIKTYSNTYKNISDTSRPIVSSDTVKGSSHGEDMPDSCKNDLNTNKETSDRPSGTKKDFDTFRDTTDMEKYLTDPCKNNLFSSKIILENTLDTYENLKSLDTTPVKDSSKPCEEDSNTKSGNLDSCMDEWHSCKEALNVIKDSLDFTDDLHSCKDVQGFSNEASALNIVETVNYASDSSKCDSVISKYVADTFKTPADTYKEGGDSSKEVVDSSNETYNTCSKDTSVTSVNIPDAVKDRPIPSTGENITNMDISDCFSGALNTSVSGEDSSDNKRDISDSCGREGFDRSNDRVAINNGASQTSKGTSNPSTGISNTLNNTSDLFQELPYTCSEASLICKDDSDRFGDAHVASNNVSNEKHVDSYISKGTSDLTKGDSKDTSDGNENVTDVCKSVSNASTDVTDVSTDVTDVSTDVTDVRQARSDVCTGVTDVSTDVTDVMKDISDVADVRKKDVSNVSTDISSVLEEGKLSVFDIGNVSDQVANIKKVGTTKHNDPNGETLGQKNEESNFCDEPHINKQKLTIMNKELEGLCPRPIEHPVSLESSEEVKNIVNEKDGNLIYVETQDSTFNQQPSLPNFNDRKIGELPSITQSRKRARANSSDNNSIVKKVKFSEPIPRIDTEESDDESDLDDPNRLVIIENENELSHNRSKIIVSQDKSIVEKSDSQTASTNSDSALETIQHVDSNDNLKTKKHSLINGYVLEAQTTDDHSDSTSKIDDDAASDIEVIEIINEADSLSTKYSVEGICEKCCETWNSKILKLLFEGNESVTIKSKITYGAIICMNNYAKLHYKFKEEIAVRKLLNRAGLGLSKNLSSIKISELNHQILERIKNGRMSCCDVFYLLYLVKKGSAYAVNKNSKLKIDDFINIADDDDEPSSNEKLAASSANSTSLSTPVVKETSNEIESISSKTSLKITEAKTSSSEQTKASHLSVSKKKNLTNWEVISTPYSKKMEHLKKSIVSERENLSSDVVVFYDQLTCQVATSEEEILADLVLKRKNLKNVDVLNVFFLFKNDVKFDCNTLFKLLFQIAFLRSRIILIPDGSTLVKVMEELEKSMVNNNDLNFEFDEWDSERLYSTPVYGYPITKYPSIREILALFCSWSAKTLLSCQLYKQFDLKDALFKLFKEKINVNDSCGLCIRLYARYCALLFQQKEPAKSNLYLSLFYLPKKEQSALKRATVLPHDISILPPSNQNISKHVQYLKESKSLPSKLKRKLPDSIINYKLIQTKKMKSEILSQVKDERIQSLLKTYSHIHPDVNKHETPVTSTDRHFTKSSQSRAMVNKMYSVLKADNVPNEKIEYVISKVLSIIR